MLCMAQHTPESQLWKHVYRKLEDKIDENHKKLREEIREDLPQISAVQIRGSGTQRRHSPARERDYTPRAELWFFLRDCGENMNRWDGKSTAALAQRVRELKEVKTQRGSSTKREAAPVACSRTARCDNDDMSDPLEGTSKTHAQGKKDNQAWRGPTSSQMIQELESQGVVSKTHSPFNSPIWPVRKSEGEWSLTVDDHALNEVTPPLSAAVPDMLELQYKLESKAAKWYATIDIANAFFSIPLAAECRSEFAFTWRGVQYTWNRLPQGWKHSPTICHGLIQTALGKDCEPLYLVTRKKNDFHWGPEQQQAFAQMKQEIAHVVALGPVRTGPDVKNVLYSAAGSHGLSWSLWQKVPGMNRK
ncbi:hypothetical protein DUI87_02698 [Hirundo rustica rustica]|uniref:ribonuclease H n=1 Tax=Hirundo rustica rustica TaxID=333673 RepID=A0A3M0L8V0_HIRRU|nr:hypothetical protein DUI87_02698 [Hirundo rustica rustica]